MKPGTTGSSTNVFGGAQAQPTNSSPFGAFSNAQNQNQGQTGTPNIFGQQGQQQQQQPTTGSSILLGYALRLNLLKYISYLRWF